MMRIAPCASKVVNVGKDTIAMFLNGFDNIWKASRIKQKLYVGDKIIIAIQL